MRIWTGAARPRGLVDAATEADPRSDLDYGILVGTLAGALDGMDTSPGGGTGSTGSGDDDGEDGDGEGEGDEYERIPAADREMVRRIVKRYGSFARAVHALGKDNFRDRERLRGKEGIEGREFVEENVRLQQEIREADRQIDELRRDLRAAQRRAPKDAVVLTGDEKAEWEAFRALGKKAAEVKTALDEGATTAERLAKLERKSLYATASTSLPEGRRFRPDVLEDMAETKKLELQMKEVEEEDPKDAKKRVKVSRPFARFAAETSGEFLPLGDFVDQKLPLYRPALEQEDESSGERDASGEVGIVMPPQGRTAPRRTSDRKSGVTAAVNSHLSGYKPPTDLVPNGTVQK